MLSNISTGDFGQQWKLLGDSAYISSDFPFVVTSDILVLKLISVLVFILFSSQNFYFIYF